MQDDTPMNGFVVGNSTEIDPIYAQGRSLSQLEILKRKLRGVSLVFPSNVKTAMSPEEDLLALYKKYRYWNSRYKKTQTQPAVMADYLGLEAPPQHDDPAENLRLALMSATHGPTLAPVLGEPVKTSMDLASSTQLVNSFITPHDDGVLGFMAPPPNTGGTMGGLQRLLMAVSAAGSPGNYKQADHPQDRLEQRTSLPANYTHRLRKVLAKTPLPKGDAYARMPDNSFAVFKDAGGRKRLASFLSKHMTPRGKNVTVPVREGLKTAGSRLRELVTVAPVPGFPSVWRMHLNGKEIGEARLAEGAAGLIARIKNMDMYHKYHGMGLGKKFYGEIMRSMPGGALASDIGTVSPHARRVWRGMRDRGYNLWENTAGELNPAGTELLNDEFRIFQLRKAPDFIAELPASVPAGPHAEIFKDIRRVVPLKNSAEELAALASGRERDRVLLEEGKKDRLRALLEKSEGLKTAESEGKSKSRPMSDKALAKALGLKVEELPKNLHTAVAEGPPQEGTADLLKALRKMSKTAGFANESLAQKAHQVVLDEYGLTEADGSKYWKLKTSIYKKMGGTFTGRRDPPK